MAESPAAVADTHALVFHAEGGKRLGKRAAAHFRACDRREAVTFVPMAVAWEVCSLMRAGRIDLRRSPRDFFDRLFANPAYQALEIDLEQILLADERRPSDDPFDALICAAAGSLDLPLLTRDEAIHDAGIVDWIW